MRLDLSEAAAKVLLTDGQDELFFRVDAPDGSLLGGDEALPPARDATRRRPAPRYYGDELHGQPVRMIAASMPIAATPGAPLVHVLVAETLHKRTRLAWEMVASTVLPQLLLIVMATAVVWFGVSRGLEPLQRLRRAVGHRSHLDLSPINTADVPGEVRPLVDDWTA